MKFEEVLPALREGKKIRRKIWPCGSYIYISKGFSNEILFQDKTTAEASLFHLIFSNDWEILEEPKKKVKYYQILYQTEDDKEFHASENKYKSLEDFSDKIQSFCKPHSIIEDSMEERDE